MKGLLLILLVVSASVLASEYPDSDRWLYTIGGFVLEDEIIGDREGQIVATGSSSMRFWGHSIQQDFAPLPIISRGFGGSNMNDVLSHLDDLILKHKPRAVIIYEGDNDIAQGVPVPVVLATFKKVITRILDDFSETRIYLISVKPSIARESLWGDMTLVNQGMRTLAEQKNNVFYIDVATPMLNVDGSRNPDLYVSDGLHLSQAGYDVWRRVVVPFVMKREADQYAN